MITTYSSARHFRVINSTDTMTVCCITLQTKGCQNVKKVFFPNKKGKKPFLTFQHPFSWKIPMPTVISDCPQLQGPTSSLWQKHPIFASWDFSSPHLRGQPEQHLQNMASHLWQGNSTQVTQDRQMEDRAQTACYHHALRLIFSLTYLPGQFLQDQIGLEDVSKKVEGIEQGSSRLMQVQRVGVVVHPQLGNKRVYGETQKGPHRAFVLGPSPIVRVPGNKLKATQLFSWITKEKQGGYSVTTIRQGELNSPFFHEGEFNPPLFQSNGLGDHFFAPTPYFLLSLMRRYWPHLRGQHFASEMRRNTTAVQQQEYRGCRGHHYAYGYKILLRVVI